MAGWKSFIAGASMTPITEYRCVPCATLTTFSDKAAFDPKPPCIHAGPCPKEILDDLRRKAIVAKGNLREWTGPQPTPGVTYADVARAQGLKQDF